MMQSINSRYCSQLQTSYEPDYTINLPKAEMLQRAWRLWLEVDAAVDLLYTRGRRFCLNLTAAC